MNRWQGSETVEFKENWTEKALESLVAFANHKGGVLYLGVKDNGEVTGSSTTDRMQQRISGQIYDKLRVFPTIAIEEREGKTILAVHISSSGSLVNLDGKFLLRSGSTNRPMSGDEIGKRAMNQRGITWDVIKTDWGLDKVDPDLVSQFIRFAKERTIDISENDSIEHVLKNLGILNEGFLNRAGVLLFTKIPHELFHGVRLRIGRFKDADIIDDKEFTGFLFDQLNLAIDRLKTLLTVRSDIKVRALNLEDFQRKEMWEYPLEALREAILNALIHRDYGVSGDIQIRVYRDSLSVWNPGGLLDGINIEDLYKREHTSRLRNPRIAEVFKLAGFIEKWGTGTYRMLTLFEEQKLPEPAFESDGNSFKVGFIKDLYTIERLTEKELNQRQIKAVLFIKEHGQITNTAYQHLTGVKKRQATLDLKDLEKKDILTRKGTRGRGTGYILKQLSRRQSMDR